jgi:hypothetical protein
MIKSYQAATLEWISARNWRDPFAVTLTLKQRCPETGICIDSITASGNFRHFTNLLSRKCLGSAFKRYGQRVQIIPVLEGGNGKRWHYHAMADCPRSDISQRFPDLIRQAWTQTHWGYHETDVRPCDMGWLKYILKHRDKPSFDLALDWQNCQLAERSA